MTARQVFGLWPAQVARAWRRWWFANLEQHYLISAEVETKRAREAQANAAYYQKRAAMARSDRISA